MERLVPQPPLHMPSTTPLRIPCHHLHLRVEHDPNGEPIAQHCEACGRCRTMRPLRHRHFNEHTFATGWLSEEQVQAGQLPEASILVETEFDYGPWVRP